MFIDRIIEKGIIFLLIFTPLAFGTVQPWSIAVMEITAFSLFFLFLLKSDSKLFFRPNGFLKTPNSPAPRRLRTSRGPLPLLLILFSLLMVLSLIQMLPLPQGLLNLISPSSLSTYKKFGDFASGSFHPISLNPYGTRQELFKWLAYGAVFFVVVNHFQTRAQVLPLVKTILIMACFLVVFALIQKITWNGRIFWIYPIDETLRSGSGIWGTYINRNHFAGYLEMAIPLGLGLLLYNAPDLKTGHDAPLTKRMGRFLAGDTLVPFTLLFLLVLVMAACLIMTLSRGGILGFAASTLFFAWLTRERRSLRKKAPLLALLAAVIFAVVVLASWDILEQRFEELQKERQISRLTVWKDSLGLIRDYPVVGSGLGSFEKLYMGYQTKMPELFFDHAHNDYLELLTDTGLIGALLAMGMTLVFFLSLYRRWRKKHGLFSKCLGAGGLCACMAMAVHSFTDFNLHISANALLFTIICAIIYVVIFNITGRKVRNNEAVENYDINQGRITDDQGPRQAIHDPEQNIVIVPEVLFPDKTAQRTKESFVSSPATGSSAKKNPLYIMALLVLAVLFLFFPVRDLIADYFYRQVGYILDDKTTEGLSVKPISGKSMPDYFKALSSLKTAAALSPYSARYQKALSEFYFRLGKWAETMESLKAALPMGTLSPKEATTKGQFHLEEAISLEPTNPDYHLALGQFYDTAGGDPRKADQEFKKAVEAFPDNAPLRYAVAMHYLLSGRTGDALEQAGVLARIDESYIIPESAEKNLMVEKRTPGYVAILSHSYLFGALEIAWRASKDPQVVKGIAPDTPDAAQVVQVFMDARNIK